MRRAGGARSDRRRKLPSQAPSGPEYKLQAFKTPEKAEDTLASIARAARASGM